MLKVTLIGDSIRMGYQPFVAQALAGEADGVHFTEEGYRLLAAHVAEAVRS